MVSCGGIRYGGDLQVSFSVLIIELKYILAANSHPDNPWYQEKLADGVHLKAEQIIGSVEAVGTCLEERYAQGASVYVVGEPGFRRHFSSQYENC